MVNTIEDIIEILDKKKSTYTKPELAYLGFGLFNLLTFINNNFEAAQEVGYSEYTLKSLWIFMKSLFEFLKPYFENPESEESDILKIVSDLAEKIADLEKEAREDAEETYSLFLEEVSPEEYQLPPILSFYHGANIIKIFRMRAEKLIDNYIKKLT